MSDTRPKVGIGLLIVRGNRVLLGKRKGTHGAGHYGGVGGHLEHLETFEECIMRELAEEAGIQLKVKNLRMICVTNMRAYAPKHYIDIGMAAEWEDGEPEVMEPHKLEAWEWHDIDRLPEPLFAVMNNYVEAYRNGHYYFKE